MDQNEGSQQNASSSTGKIAAKSHEAAEQWKEAVVGQVNETRDRVLSAREHTTERIRGVATQLRNLSDNLREEDPLIAKVAQRGSQSVEGVARYVSNATPQSIINDTEQLARRQPALFFGGAFLLGLAAGRFVKSSRPQGNSQYGSRYGESRYENGEREVRENDSYTSRETEGGPGQRLTRDSGFFSPSEGSAYPSGSSSAQGAGGTFGREAAAGTQETREGQSSSPSRASAGAGASNDKLGSAAKSARKGSIS
jgi:hypothetical protein